jgi:pyridoxine 5-phosphate synthase
MMRKKLGVNIDHVATLRNARGEDYPNPLKAALIAEKSGANYITVHLREDRRHIRDYDLKNIKNKIKIPFNLEIAPTNEMTSIALKYKPDFVCIVPEKRKEITTEGGMNLNFKKKYLKKVIEKLKKNKIRVSLFIDPKISAIDLAKELGANCVEIHTGKYCNLHNKKKKTFKAISEIKKCAFHANMIGLEVHAGHGLNYSSTKKISHIKEISVFNIGHFLISDSIFVSLKNSIKKFKNIINK